MGAAGEHDDLVALIDLIEAVLVHHRVQMEIYAQFPEPRNLFLEYLTGKPLFRDAEFELSSEFIIRLIDIDGMSLKGELPCRAHACGSSADDRNGMTRRCFLFRGRQVEGEPAHHVYL